MKVSSLKWLFILLLPVSIILFLSFRKSTSLSVEGKFGTFCLSCKAYESGSAFGTYGFGLAYCDDNIKKMFNKVDYDEIEKFKLYLNDKGLFTISDKVSDIAEYLKTNDTEKYVSSVKDYSNEIERLNSKDKEIVLLYLNKKN